MDLVIDASVAMGWLLQSQSDALTEAAEAAVVDGNGWVPGHFGVEVLRSLRRFERSKTLSPEVVDGALARLHRVELKQDASSALERLQFVVLLARNHTLRVADAAYLELALRLRLPLATRDEALARAAQDAGATLFKA